MSAADGLPQKCKIPGRAVTFVLHGFAMTVRGLDRIVQRTIDQDIAESDISTIDVWLDERNNFVAEAKLNNRRRVRIPLT